MTQQDLEGIREFVVPRLDEVATCHPSTMAWDRFAFLQTNQKTGERKYYLITPERSSMSVSHARVPADVTE